MRSTTTTCLSLVLLLIVGANGEQQRILRRVIKSTPTATNLARVRLVSVRSPSAEAGAVTEISSKEAANFGKRANETAPTTGSPAQGLKGKLQPTSSTSATSTTTSTTTTAPPSTTSARPSQPTTSATTEKPSEVKHKASDRQQAAPQAAEVELLASAPSSWQHMMAVEAPAAMLIATGARSSVASNDLASSASSADESSSSTGDFLRSASSTKGSSYTANSETFSRLSQSNNRQQNFFHPAATRASGKTSQVQATKTHWYQPTSTTPRPAPIIQEQQYEQQNEQYVEQQQQQQVEYGAAPLGQAEPFAFDFKTEDNSGNGQYRKEESDKNGVVRGSYGYTDANGIYRHVDYVADHNGFRANIKSNEPGLIGETQPASIQLAGGAQPQGSQRVQAAPSADNGDWTPNNYNNQGSSADLALAPPDFESSHKSDRIRTPRHYRN